MNDRSFETLLYCITANTIAKIMEKTGWSENETMERFTESQAVFVSRKGRKQGVAVQRYDACRAF